MARRPIKVSVPESTGGEVHLKGTQMHPNYALNSIVVNPSNPRRRDLDAAGLTLQRVKRLRREESESVDKWAERIEKWIDQTEELTAEGKTQWARLLSLALSVLHGGLIQPVTLRVASPGDKQATLIAGERRFLAHWLAGKHTIWANQVIRNDDEVFDMGLIENTQKHDLSLSATMEALNTRTRQGQELGLKEVMMLTNNTKAYASFMLKALRLPSDHPVNIGIEEGTISKPYHINAELKKAERKLKSEEKTKTSGVTETNLEDGRGLNLNQEDKFSSESEQPPSKPGSQSASSGEEKVSDSTSNETLNWPRIRKIVYQALPAEHRTLFSSNLDKVDSPESLAKFLHNAAEALEGET